ncbi:type II secretion system protein GspG [beta proteobacterium AAP99]|nr:type II secretion system protein GspG [beta proteobacterium AAP99]
MRSASNPPTSVRHSSSGFTLLELLVVIVIIGLLASYVGPKYFGQLGKSEVTVARAQLEAFSQALDTYRLDMGRYPTAEEGLRALVARPAGAETSPTARWNGPYLKTDLPLDPWGRPYQYRTPGARGEYEVASLGQDGHSSPDLVRP